MIGIHLAWGRWAFSSMFHRFSKHPHACEGNFPQKCCPLKLKMEKLSARSPVKWASGLIFQTYAPSLIEQTRFRRSFLSHLNHFYLPSFAVYGDDFQNILESLRFGDYMHPTTVCRLVYSCVSVGLLLCVGCSAVV